MHKCVALALLVTLSWIGALGQDARAGVTIDVHFADMTVASNLTIRTSIPTDHIGPGCTFTGYYGRTVSTGRCMDVILTTTDELVIVQASVGYDSDNRLAVASFNEWVGMGVSWNEKGTLKKSCLPIDGVTDDGSEVGGFDCAIPLPAPPGTMPAGTYRIGTIVWDTSRTTAWGSELGSEAINVLVTGVGAVINGNVVNLTDQVVLGSHVLHILAIPEPGTAALLGLAFVGLALAERRRRG